METMPLANIPFSMIDDFFLASLLLCVCFIDSKSLEEEAKIEVAINYNLKLCHDIPPKENCMLRDSDSFFDAKEPLEVSESLIRQILANPQEKKQ